LLSYERNPHGQRRANKRPELAQCLTALDAGDTLIVWKLDRLDRSLRDLIGLLVVCRGH